MKCPKCEYLGFETGDRCKNCGYDFSLATGTVVTRDTDLPLHVPVTQDSEAADRWLDQLGTRLDTGRATPSISIVDTRHSAPVTRVATPAQPVVPAGAEVAVGPAPAAAAHIRLQKAPAQRASLPLFTAPQAADWDEPLITVPPAPRPLAVRRTPDRPRLRTVQKPPRKVESDPAADPVLAFPEEPAAAQASARATSPNRPSAAAAVETSGAVRRLVAAFVDHVILFSVDAAVVYFTFQIAGVPFESWRDVPVLPLALFLTLLKLAYFSVFTTLGGQTVGKMAAGIRVVTDDNRDVDPALAVRRTLAAVASFATAGIGFAPALVGGDRRALHDRVARTRVVRPLHE